MQKPLDAIDRKLLELVQLDADRPISEFASAVNLSPTPCWRRIQRMREAGVIMQTVSLVNAKAINLRVNAFVLVRTVRHSIDWLERFEGVVQSIPEIVEFYRMSGQVDYLLRVVAPDIESYDAVYRKLIRSVEFADISTSFVMGRLKHTTALPVVFAG